MKVKTADDWKSMQDIATIAQIMAGYRKKAGLDVKDVAKAMEIPLSSLYAYEKGERPIQMHVWLRWCKAVGIKHRSAAETIAIKCGYDQQNRFRDRRGKKCQEQN